MTINHVPTQGIMAELGVTSEDATAEELGISPVTLSKMRKAGRAPQHTVIGRKIFYTREAKRRWIENGGERDT
jgi:hypothetical protein